MAQFVQPFKVHLDDRREAAPKTRATRTTTQTVNDDSDKQGKSIKSSLARADTKTTPGETNEIRPPSSSSQASCNPLSRTVMSGSMQPVLINLARLLLSSWPITCFAGRSLADGLAWLASLASRFMGSLGRSSFAARSEKPPSATMECTKRPRDSDLDSQSQALNSSENDIYTSETIEFKPSIENKPSETMAASEQARSTHQSRTPPAESRQHSDSDDQQVVAELLGAELSELLLGQALEAAKIRMTNHEPTCVAEEPASQSAQSSESQQPEERGRGASEPQLSNMPEFHRLRTNSEVERYSDQVAQLFTSLAGINETNEEQAADEPEVNAGDENGQSNDARMTTMSNEVDQANQDTSGDNQGSIVQPHTTSEQATSGTQQEEVVATGDCEPSATREGELDELSRPKAVESRSPAADGETRQEDPSKTRSESPAEESSNECPYSASSLAAAPVDKDTNRDRIGNEPDLVKARTSSVDSTFSDSSSAELPEELARKEEHSSEEDSCCVSGCICGDEAEEFCGETASNSTLRRLKMNTFEDVLVCEQNRQSMAAARRLFGQLARAGETGEQTTGSKEIKKPKAGKWGGSLSSAEEPEEESDEMDEEEMRQSASSNKNTQSDNNSDGNDSEGLLKAFDTIKIVRRSGSSASSSNFRQTLVCSVSPTSQLGGSNLDMSVADTNHPIYPIDGEEIIQCRAAFRENKRLIEEQQERARNILADCSSSNKNRASSPLTGGTRNFRLNRTDRSYLDRSMKQSKCSRCQLRVYPVDRMELDFTRTTLNIHRNCFKCQICSTLLRLETYAALDAKLYCPSHIKCVMPSR